MCMAKRQCTHCSVIRHGNAQDTGNAAHIRNDPFAADTKLVDKAILESKLK